MTYEEAAYLMMAGGGGGEARIEEIIIDTYGNYTIEAPSDLDGYNPIYVRLPDRYDEGYARGFVDGMKYIRDLINPDPSAPSPDPIVVPPGAEIPPGQWTFEYPYTKLPPDEIKDGGLVGMIFDEGETAATNPATGWSLIIRNYPGFDMTKPSFQFVVRSLTGDPPTEYTLGELGKGVNNWGEKIYSVLNNYKFENGRLLFWVTRVYENGRTEYDPYPYGTQLAGFEITALEACFGPATVVSHGVPTYVPT